MQIPTFVIGPGDPEGRNFRFLAESVNLARLPPRQQVTVFDLPLALAAWASQGERDCVACIPLSDDPGPVVVLRAEMFGNTGIGRLVYANALLVDGAALAALGGAPEKLLPLIPRPDQGTTFGRAAIDVDPDSLRQLSAGEFGDPMLGFGLAWEPRFVGVADASMREEVLCRALASIELPAQRQIARGWTTSGCWLERNSFDPAHLFWLVVGDPEDHQRQSRLIWQLTPDASDQPKVLPPANLAIWQALHSAVEPWRKLTAESDWAEWSPTFQHVPARKMVAHILEQADATFGRTEMLALLAKLAQSDQPIFVTEARDLFWRLVDETVPEIALTKDSGPVDRLLTSHPDAVPPVFGQSSGSAVDATAALQSAIVAAILPATSAQILRLSPAAMAATVAALSRHAPAAGQAAAALTLARLVLQGHGAARQPFAQLLALIMGSGLSLPSLCAPRDMRAMLEAAASACPDRFFQLTRQLPPLPPPPTDGGPSRQDIELAGTMVTALNLSARFAPPLAMHMETP